MGENNTDTSELTWAQKLRETMPPDWVVSSELRRAGVDLTDGGFVAHRTHSGGVTFVNSLRVRPAEWPYHLVFHPLHGFVVVTRKPKDMFTAMYPGARGWRDYLRVWGVDVDTLDWAPTPQEAVAHWALKQAHSKA